MEKGKREIGNRGGIVIYTYLFISLLFLSIRYIPNYLLYLY